MRNNLVKNKLKAVGKKHEGSESTEGKEIEEINKDKKKKKRREMKRKGKTE